MNWANLATYSRIVMIPIVIACYYSGAEFAHLLAAIVFAVASLTDWLDGYLARKLNQTSKFGAFLDPVADKLLVSVVLIMLVAAYEALMVAAAIIITRELLISALREWMALRDLRNKVAVMFSGKLKTTVQMVAIIILLLVDSSLPEWVWYSGYLLLNLAALISVWSMLRYFRNAWSVLVPKTEKP
jgi:CDP-diacylglycerol--glycerol-3-phosphate 3-phosphatidyltransferase